MPAYVPNYQHDIFVSYAHVDNEPLAGSDKGWVTTLITELKKLLSQKLGRVDAYSLWMDYRLTGNRPVTPDIDEQVKSTASFVLILSPGYLASQWCVLEYTTFLQQIGANSWRIFLIEKDFIERDSIERDNKLPGLRELRGYPFWVRNEDTGKIRTLGVPRPNPEREPEYYQLLDELATELTTTLNRLKNQGLNMDSQSSDSDNLSALQRKLRKTRLQNEKVRLEAERDRLIQEYETLAAKLSTTVDVANLAMFNNQLRELEENAKPLEQQIAKIDSELSQLS